MRGHLALAAAAVVAALALPALAHAAAPSNDAFAAAEQISGASGAVAGTEAEATTEPGEPASMAGHHSIWYAWTAPDYGVLSFDTSGTTWAWVFTGDALGSLDLKINGQGYGFVQVRAGVTYRFALDDWSDGGPTQLSWSFEQGPPPPANDDWANAAPLDGAAGTVQLDNLGATKEPCDPYLAYGRSVWYSWIAPGDGQLVVTPDSTTRGTAAGVYTGDSLCGLEQRAWSGGDPAYADVVAGRRYWIGIDTSGSFGPTSFSWSYGPVTRPANDLFANAQDLGPSYRGSTSGTTLNGTPEPGEHVTWGHSVWYTWTPAESGLANLDVQLADGTLYTGASLDTLTSLGNLPAQLEVTAGTRYVIQVDSGGRGGDFTLGWLLKPNRAPANDSFATPQYLDGPSGRVESTNRFATLEPGEPDHGGTSAASVWFAWTAAADGTATFHVDSSAWAIHVVYTGDSLATLVRPEQTQDVAAQVVSFQAVAGTTYRIAVNGRSGGTSTFWLDWTSAEPPPPPPPPAPNNPPAPKADQLSTAVNTPLVVSPAKLLANDYDPDGDTLQLVSVSIDKKSNGTVRMSKGQIVFTPATDFTGTGRFVYTVADPQGLQASTFAFVTIGAANRAPTVSVAADATAVPEGGSLVLRAQAKDPDGDPLTYKWSTDGGRLDANGGTATLTADDGPATVEVTVTVSDGKLSSSATFAVAVDNVAPAVDAQGAAGVWGAPLTVSGSATDPSAADTAAGLTPSWAIGGTTVGSWTATHVFEQPGSYTATLSATDKDGGTGSRDVTVDVGKRASSIAYTGPATAVFGFGTVAAKLADAFDPATARPDGHTIVFAAGGRTWSASTAGGAATATVGPSLLPGTYAVEARLGDDALYAGSATTGSLTVASSVGKVSGGGALSDGTAVSFNVSNDGARLRGTLTAGTFTANEVTAIGIAGSRAWIGGTGTDGRAFTAYLEDNAEPGAGADVFRLWVGGAQQPGSGTLAEGNVQVHK